MNTGLRNAAIFTFIVSMAILLTGGYFIQDKVPPIPEKVVSGGNVLTEGAAILRGQDAYQRYGLMDHGSVWGHGSLRGMDFSAYTLHCVGDLVKQHLAAEGKPSADAWQKLPPEPRRELDELDAKVIKELRANRYDEQSKTLELTPAQALRLGTDAAVLGPDVLPRRLPLRLSQERRTHRRRNAKTWPISSSGPPGQPARIGPA